MMDDDDGDDERGAYAGTSASSRMNTAPGAEGLIHSWDILQELSSMTPKSAPMEPASTSETTR